MSRTYRRKKQKFYSTLEEYITPNAWDLAGMEAEYGWGRGKICKSIEEYEEYWAEQYKRDTTRYKHDMWGHGYKINKNMKHEANRKRRTDERGQLAKTNNPIFKPFKRYTNIWDWD